MYEIDVLYSCWRCRPTGRADCMRACVSLEVHLPVLPICSYRDCMEGSTLQSADNDSSCRRRTENVIYTLTVLVGKVEVLL